MNDILPLAGIFGTADAVGLVLEMEELEVLGVSMPVGAGVATAVSDGSTAGAHASPSTGAAVEQTKKLARASPLRVFLNEGMARFVCVCFWD